MVAHRRVAARFDRFDFVASRPQLRAGARRARSIDATVMARGRWPAAGRRRRYCFAVRAHAKRRRRRHNGDVVVGGVVYVVVVVIIVVIVGASSGVVVDNATLDASAMGPSTQSARAGGASGAARGGGTRERSAHCSERATTCRATAASAAGVGEACRGARALFACCIPRSAVFFRIC